MGLKALLLQLSQLLLDLGCTARCLTVKSSDETCLCWDSAKALSTLWLQEPKDQPNSAIALLNSWPLPTHHLRLWSAIWPKQQPVLPLDQPRTGPATSRPGKASQHPRKSSTLQQLRGNCSQERPRSRAETTGCEVASTGGHEARPWVPLPLSASGNSVWYCTKEGKDPHSPRALGCTKSRLGLLN